MLSSADQQGSTPSNKEKEVSKTQKKKKGKKQDNKQVPVGPYIEICVWFLEDKEINRRIGEKIIGSIHAKNKGEAQPFKIMLRHGVNAAEIIRIFERCDELDKLIQEKGEDNVEPQLKEEWNKLHQECQSAIRVFDNSLQENTVNPKTSQHFEPSIPPGAPSVTGITLESFLQNRKLTDHQLAEFTAAGFNKDKIIELQKLTVKLGTDKIIGIINSDQKESYKDSIEATGGENKMILLPKGEFTKKTFAQALNSQTILQTIYPGIQFEPNEGKQHLMALIVSPEPVIPDSRRQVDDPTKKFKEQPLKSSKHSESPKKYSISSHPEILFPDQGISKRRSPGRLESPNSGKKTKLLNFSP